VDSQDRPISGATVQHRLIVFTTRGGCFLLFQLERIHEDVFEKWLTKTNQTTNRLHTPMFCQTNSYLCADSAKLADLEVVRFYFGSEDQILAFRILFLDSLPPDGSKGEVHRVRISGDEWRTARGSPHDPQTEDRG
jgi:hypothetical protein